MTSTPALSPTVVACLAVSRAEAEIRRRFDHALGSYHGLSFNDFTVLLHLRRSPADRMRRTELAGRLGITQSGLARLLIALEKVGLVTRQADASDGRVAVVVLTEAGIRVADEALETAEQAARESFAGLGGAEVEALTTLAWRLAPTAFALSWSTAPDRA